MSDDNGSKRTRASGEVLDYLLEAFKQNHNPSPEQRREISEKTNMSEKAVRIWFQNRRAKLRKFERMGKKSDSGSTGDASPYSASLSARFEMSSPPSPIDISEKYCFIDCSSLSVASWQRVRTGNHHFHALKNTLVNLSPFTLNGAMSSADLLVILSKKNSEINYFFSAMANDSKILFRIFYPISSIVTCSLLDNNINKGSNELRLSLSAPPKFSVFFFNNVNSEANQWSICDDFSEDQQVSTAYCNDGGTSIPHVLVGVKSTLQFLHAYILELNQLPHHPPRYHTDLHLGDIQDDNHESGNFQINTESLDVWQDKSPLGVDSRTSPASGTSVRSHDMAEVAPLVASGPEYENYNMEYRDQNHLFDEELDLHPSNSNNELLASPSASLENLPHNPGLDSHQPENFAFTVDNEYIPEETPPEDHSTGGVDSFIDYNAK